MSFCFVPIALKIPISFLQYEIEIAIKLVNKTIVNNTNTRLTIAKKGFRW